jgi:S-DNA-T family DNA segregation ATPase FtsK/SpoIIIE
MKIKFTLQRSGAPSVDLVATVDATTTVGALAEHLLVADPAGGRPDPRPADGRHAADGPATLGVVGARHVTLDPRLPVGESGLRSGATVSIGRAGRSYAEPQTGPAVAVVRVVSGPDTGREYPLPRGTATIGRERGCEVRLTDGMVSRQHARLNITEVAEIVDLGSSNGVQIGDAVVPRTVLRPGDVVRVGETELAVYLTHSPAAAKAPDGATVAFVRSPRLDPRYDGRAYETPEPPERPATQRFPLIPLLAPVLMGGILYLATRSPTSLIFVALSPIMLVGNAVESRLAGRSAFRKASAQWRADVADLVTEVTEAAGTEVVARTREHPSTAECVEAVRQRSPLLWTRRPGEHGFAEFRLGLGRQPARNRIELGNNRRAPRDLTRELVAAVAPFSHVDGVPIVAAAADGALGVAGSRAAALDVGRAVVVQAAALHSPGELVVAGFASARSAPDWDWVKWLPHSSSAHSPVAARLLASAPAACVQLASELEDLLDRRAAARDAPRIPAVLVLVEDDAPLDHSRLVGLAERGAALGVHVLWIAADTSLLPAACRTFVEVAPDAPSGAVGYVHRGEAVHPVAVDRLGADLALEIARRLAPLVDAGARMDDDSDLPRAVSLLTLAGTELANLPGRVIERWVENRSIVTGRYAPATGTHRPGSLRAIIGQSAAGPLALDLRSEGPHALVGGTTGSGKSELLQAWILGMAAAHSPQRVTFLLVDYKGGSAFQDCRDLPHTVGLVTDLSPHLVRRALTSLSAELRHREELLATHKAKDLVELERRGVTEAPPSLVIVVDEFAALVQEVPEFVEGVVNVAQRGRSLGLHLILATQRPAGVIKDNLRANTNLRLALRMADESDSSDVLGSPEAAAFDPALPGRAVCKSGPGRLVPFQAGYAGGWTTDEPPPAEIAVEQLAFGTGHAWEVEQVDNRPLTDLGPTDIQRMVTSISAANTQAALPAARIPWLPALAEAYDLSAVPAPRQDNELVFGIRDDPDHQAQPTIAFHPDRDGNLAIYGTGGSGKSTFLRTIAIAASNTIRGGPCHVYGIDFGAQGLAMLEELPHVGSIVTGSDHERIGRLLRWLRSLIDERAAQYSRVNAGTVADYRQLGGRPAEPRILLLLDGMGAFRAEYEVGPYSKLFDTFLAIATDGRPVGIHVLVTADRASAVPAALGATLQRRIVLRLADDSDRAAFGLKSDVLPTAMPPGRGFDDSAEIQIAVFGGSAGVLDQASAVRRLAEAMQRAEVQPAPSIGRLPDLVPIAGLPACYDLPGVGDAPVIGLGAADLAPAVLNPRGTFLITGPPGSGRTGAVLTLAHAVRRWRPDAELYYFGPRRSPLHGLLSWTAAATSGEEAAELAGKLTDAVRAGHYEADRLAVFIESLPTFENGPADSYLQDLVRACLAEDLLVVAEGDVKAVSASYGLVALARTSQAGIVLQPDQMDGMLFRTDFPKVRKAEFPVGRGLLVGRGKASVVQLAKAD